MKNEKIECIYCKKEMDPSSTICPHCGKDNNVDRLTKHGIHILHQNAHNNITKYNELKDQAMVFIVVGSILLIVGIIFLILSFKFDFLRRRVFSPASIEFIASVICLVISGLGFGFGIPKLIKSIKAIKFYNNVILTTEAESK